MWLSKDAELIRGRRLFEARCLLEPKEDKFVYYFKMSTCYLKQAELKAENIKLNRKANICKKCI